MTTEKAKYEPLFHITKRGSVTRGRALLVRAVGVFAALVICGIMSVILIKENPFKIYGTLVTGAFIDVWTLAKDTAVLLMFGLAVIPAFKMKFWNMGANGQVLVGCFVAIACMKFLAGKLPNAVIIILMIVTSIAAGIVWAVIPAIFKAFFGTNETLFTLMMNYIAIGIVAYFAFMWDKSGSGTIGIVNYIGSEHYKVGWFPDIGNKYVLIIAVALLVDAFMFVYMKYTKHGFETALVGESVNTAKYVGINVKKVIIRTLILSGAICGIMGAIFAGSLEHTVNDQICGSKGFTAILVAWLAHFDPIIMIFTAFLVVFLNTGAANVSTVFQLKSTDYANIVIGIIFFCIIGSEFFIRYDIKPSQRLKDIIGRFKKKKTDEKEDTQ
ncbi:MAG: ABC transporter permease [Clostridia bacterium]|nr:ABC transporter permease [Clostridia bacterium]